MFSIRLLSGPSSTAHDSFTHPCPSISSSLTVSLLSLFYFSEAHNPAQPTRPYFSSEDRNLYALPVPSTWTFSCMRLKEALLLLRSLPGSIPSNNSSTTYISPSTNQGLPLWLKESTCNAGDLDSIPGLGRSPGKRKGYPLQYSGLENSTDWRMSIGSQRVGHDWVTFTFTTNQMAKSLSPVLK